MKKAFTLVEVIVVLVILGFLATLAFMSYSNYSARARDTKRASDVKNLLTILELESSELKPYTELLTQIETHEKTIGGETKLVTQGVINFDKLQEKREDYIDPKYNTDYEFVGIKASSTIDGEIVKYDFVEGRYWSEIEKKEMVIGNYFKYKDADADTLFTGNLSTVEKLTQDYTCVGLPDNNMVWSYTNSTTHVIEQVSTDGGETWIPDIGDIIASYDITPNSLNCNYKCADGYKLENDLCVQGETGGGGEGTAQIEYPDTVYSENGFSWQEIIIKNNAGEKYIIMDRNLGATTNDISLCQLDDCPLSIGGYFYQWGNNKARARSGFATTTTLVANTNGYGAGNFYTDPGNAFRITYDQPNDWTLIQNDDLWGDETDLPEGTDWTMRKGPCPTGYHVPTKNEWLGLVNLGFDSMPKLWGRTQTYEKSISGDYTGYVLPTGEIPEEFMEAIKIPQAGRVYVATGKPSSVGKIGRYWASTIEGSSAFTLYFTNGISPTARHARGGGASIRCFKDLN